MEVYLIYLLLINALAFLLMLVDKHKAIKNQWRIPEKALLTTAILGGSLGVIAAMRMVRHKTRKPAFSIGVPVILALQIMIVIFLIL